MSKVLRSCWTSFYNHNLCMLETVWRHTGCYAYVRLFCIVHGYCSWNKHVVADMLVIFHSAYKWNKIHKQIMHSKWVRESPNIAMMKKHAHTYIFVQLFRLSYTDPYVEIHFRFIRKPNRIQSKCTIFSNLVPLAQVTIFSSFSSGRWTNHTQNSRAVFSISFLCRKS